MKVAMLCIWSMALAGLAGARSSVDETVKPAPVPIPVTEILAKLQDPSEIKEQTEAQDRFFGKGEEEEIGGLPLPFTFSAGASFNPYLPFISGGPVYGGGGYGGGYGGEIPLPAYGGGGLGGGGGGGGLLGGGLGGIGSLLGGLFRR